MRSRIQFASGSFVSRAGLNPMGRLVGYGHAGVEPRIMGMGPVPPECTNPNGSGVAEVFERV